MLVVRRLGAPEAGAARPDRGRGARSPLLAGAGFPYLYERGRLALAFVQGLVAAALLELGALYLAPTPLGPHLALPLFCAAFAWEERTVFWRYSAPILAAYALGVPWWLGGGVELLPHAIAGLLAWGLVRFLPHGGGSGSADRRGAGRGPVLDPRPEGLTEFRLVRNRFGGEARGLIFVEIARLGEYDPFPPTESVPSLLRCPWSRGGVAMTFELEADGVHFYCSSPAITRSSSNEGQARRPGEDRGPASGHRVHGRGGRGPRDPRRRASERPYLTRPTAQSAKASQAGVKAIASRSGPDAISRATQAPGRPELAGMIPSLEDRPMLSARSWFPARRPRTCSTRTATASTTWSASTSG